ncbi:hypothetical protein [Intestinimonas sp. HCP28S3_D6]|uniref:hypothetical protein n=1 Tax=Intestinimonas sp. HCP28S3_D6 TaxID=3438942 RepID=UPI003F899208
MQYMTSLTIFFMLFFYYAVPTALLAILEYFLAKLESPWPGRVLPILSVVHALGWALMWLINLSSSAATGLLLLVPLVPLVVFNIPTLIFLLIYKNTRKKFTELRAMDRKDIQDL